MCKQGFCQRSRRFSSLKAFRIPSAAVGVQTYPTKPVTVRYQPQWVLRVLGSDGHRLLAPQLYKSQRDPCFNESDYQSQENQSPCETYRVGNTYEFFVAVPPIPYDNTTTFPTGETFVGNHHDHQCAFADQGAEFRYRLSSPIVDMENTLVHRRKRV